MTTTDVNGRRATVAAIMNDPNTQVLVLGGGINGIGTFRDLALQGVDVVLVERGDFASGTSSASSHMIHGGIRYLENGEFHLVKESVRERNNLLRVAPHFVKPLRTTVPIFSTFSGILAAPMRFFAHRRSRQVERGALLIKLGLMIYDTFSRASGTLPRHQFRGAAAARRELPQLNAKVKYTATYFDASVHEPERLALDVLHDGIAAGSNARAVNYVEANGIVDGKVRLRDTLTGKEFGIAAKVVINATGPWTDLTNGLLGEVTHYMGGTKGSHIVLDHPDLLMACAGQEIFFENSDGRIVLIYPLRGKVMVGTTDLEADIRAPVRCTEEECAYFIDLIGHVFPDVRIDCSQIVYRFAGVRPLPRHGDVRPGFVSRDYHIVPSAPTGLGGATVLSLVGGKWTTFRAVAEHLVDETLGRLGAGRKVDTSGLLIGGGREYPATDAAREDWINTHGDVVGRVRAARLLARYGTRAEAVITYLETHGDDALASTDEFTVQELRYMVENEYVVHLHDVLLRRTNSGFDGAVTAAVIDETARILADALGWTSQRAFDEVMETRRIMHEDHGIALGASTTVTNGDSEVSPAPSVSLSSHASVSNPATMAAAHDRQAQ